MKNLLLTLTAGIILLIVCSKVDSFAAVEDKTASAVYELNQFDGTTTWKSFQILKSNESDMTYNRNSSDYNAPFLYGFYPNHQMWTSNGIRIVRKPGFASIVRDPGFVGVSNPTE